MEQKGLLCELESHDFVAGCQVHVLCLLTILSDSWGYECTSCLSVLSVATVLLSQGVVKYIAYKCACTECPHTYLRINCDQLALLVYTRKHPKFAVSCSITRSTVACGFLQDVFIWWKMLGQRSAAAR